MQLRITLWILTVVLSTSGFAYNQDSLRSVIAKSNTQLEKAGGHLELGNSFRFSNTDSMLFHVRKSFQITQNSDNSDLREVYAKSLCYIGLAQTDRNQHDSAFYNFMQAKQTFSDIQSIEGLALAESGFGEFYRTKGDFLKALASFKQELHFQKESHSQKGIATAYSHLGGVYFKLGKYDSALCLIDSANLFFQGISNSIDLAKCHMTQGHVFNAIGEPEMAIKSYLKALDLYKITSSQSDISGCLNNIGVLYYDLENYDKAFEYYQIAKDNFRNLEDERGVSICLNNMAEVSYKLGQISEAKRLHHASLTMAQDQGNKELLATNLNNLGCIYLDGNKLDSADIFFQQVYRIRKNKDNAVGLIEILMNISKLHFVKYQLHRKSNDIVISEDYALQSYDIAKSIQHLAEIHRSAHHLQSIYKTKSDYKRSLHYAEIAIDAKDSLNSIVVQEEIYKIENHYLIEKRNHEIKKLSEASLNKDASIERFEVEAKRDDLLILGFALLAILGSVFIFIMFRVSIRKKAVNKKLIATNKLVVSQKEEMELVTANLQTNITELQSSKRLVEQQSNRLTKQTEELQQNNRTKDKLFSIIAHDLKSPFSGMIGLTDILIEGGDTMPGEERMKFLKLMNETSRKTYNLLNNLLAWAKSQKGELSYTPELLDIEELVEDISELYMDRIKQKLLKIDMNIHDNLKVNGDFEMLHTIMRNLLSNAIKFTPSGGRIYVSSERRTNGMVFLSVLDNGVGMSKERLNTLFKIEHAKSNTGTSRESGTGLGLILCKELMDLHGGKIRVESQVDKGTRVTLELFAFQKKVEMKESTPVLSE